MPVISTNLDTIKLFYNSNSSIGKQALGYLNSTNKDVLEIDVTKTDVTGTMWKTIADNLRISISDLVDKNHPSFKQEYNNDLSLDENDWITFLGKNPDVLIHPILIVGKDYHVINNPSDIHHILEPKSK